MKKLLNVFLIFFLFTSSVYADTQKVGRCLGIITAKAKFEGQSAITNLIGNLFKQTIVVFKLLRELVENKKIVSLTLTC